MPDEPVFKITEQMYETLVEWQQETEERDNEAQPTLEEQQLKSQKSTNKDYSAESDAVDSAE